MIAQFNTPTSDLRSTASVYGLDVTGRRDSASGSAADRNSGSKLESSSFAFDLAGCNVAVDGLGEQYHLIDIETENGPNR